MKTLIGLRVDYDQAREEFLRLNNFHLDPKWVTDYWLSVIEARDKELKEAVDNFVPYQGMINKEAVLNLLTKD